MQRAVTFAGAEGTVLSNVAAGTKEMDAVNIGQLKAAGIAVDSRGNTMNSFVAYDDETRHTITLHGGIQGTRLANLAKGRRDMEAVNVSQLREAGITIDSSGNAANTLVTYDDINKERMTLRGDAKGTLLSNVAKGRADSDAVNVRQLKDAGLTLDASGNAVNALVSYVDAQKNQITFGGTAGTILSKVAQGKADTDAVNIRQLKNAGLTLDSNGDPTNAVVAYDTLSNDRISLGGSKGTIISNVKSGVADTDAVNVSQLKSNGLIGAGGTALSAVVYDTLPDGSPNSGSITLGGASAPAPVALRNVAAGRVKEGSTDAVNGDQLYQTVKIVDDLQSVGAFKYLSTTSTLGAAQALGSDALAIGGEARASGRNSVALGTNSLADRANSVSVGSKGQERQITNVKAGTADTDAVNVAQLKSTGLIDSMGNATATLIYDKTTSGATDYASVTLGNGIEGGSTLHNVASGVLVNDAVNVGQLNNAVGQLSNAISKVTNTTAVSTAFFSADGNASRDAAVSTGTHTVAAGASALASGENAVAFGAGATASADNSVALGAGSVANRANSVSVGSEGGQRQITSVAAGTAGTDAVNLDQLNRVSTNSVAQAASYTDQRFNNAQQQIRDLDRDTRKGIAAASALNVVTPYLPGRTALNAGIAAYRGQAALGIGVSRWNEKGNLNLNAGVSTSGGNSTIVRAGIGYVFGG
ncbi:YadA family autotransporter adhesin [Caballeronia humi]|uniref:YadA family autotransporter adhesin n=1 Tax=Caballeronia humi TaxID=326474 RepID=UPI0013569B7B|nr:YadA-like family protein [Caballeronia humi]